VVQKEIRYRIIKKPYCIILKPMRLDFFFVNLKCSYLQ